MEYLELSIFYNEINFYTCDSSNISILSKLNENKFKVEHIVYIVCNNPKVITRL